jgi:hypothetical protein
MRSVHCVAISLFFDHALNRADRPSLLILLEHRNQLIGFFDVFDLIVDFSKIGACVRVNVRIV